jgi:hypothetical protein
MKIVASRWAASKASTPGEGVKGVVAGVEELAV